MAILFDIDGTLMDHERAMGAAVAWLYDTVRPAMPAGEFAVAWRAAQRRHFDAYLAGTVAYDAHRRARLREAVDPGLGDAEADRIFAGYLASYEAAWSLFPDVRSCLADLSAHTLGVISNGRASEQRKKLARTGVLGAFGYVLISQECGRPKPAAEIFLQACADLGEAPGGVWYVGDQRETDADAASRAGLHGVWLDRERSAAADAGDLPVIHTLAQLPALVDGTLSAWRSEEGA